METRLKYVGGCGKSDKNFIIFFQLYWNCLNPQTTDGTLLLYSLSVLDSPKGIYNQIDPPFQNLRRDSAELFVKEAIPALMLNLVNVHFSTLRTKISFKTNFVFFFRLSRFHCMYQ